MNNEEFKEYVKEDLVKEFDWLHLGHDISYNNLPVVNLSNLDVNYSYWHNEVLSYSTEFGFTDGEPVCLTPDNYKEFKKILRTWRRHSCYFHKEMSCDMCDRDGVLLYDECTGEEVCESCANIRIKTRIKNTLEKENNEWYRI